MKWPTDALASVAVLDRQSIHPSEVDAETPYLGLEHLDGDGGIDCVETVESAGLKSNKFHFSDRHVLFGKLRPYLRKTVRPEFSGVCSTDIIPILPKGGLSRDYLFYFLRTPATVELATSRCSGANLPRLSPKQLASLRIPLPPLAEQKRIAAILDAADALRATRRESLAQLDILLQSTFLDLFGDPATNSRGWRLKKLEDLCSHVVDCPHSTPKYSDVETDYACLRSSDIQSGYLDFSETKYVGEEEYIARVKRLVPEPGDVVYCREGARFGNAALVSSEKKVCLGQRMMLFRIDPQHASSDYVCNVLNSRNIYLRIARMVGGSASPHANVRDIRTLAVPHPPTPLQDRYAAIGESVRTQKASQRAHLAELDTLFASLQSRAFRGDL